MVLAGDPKQLGPILRSPLAIQYGLGEATDYWMCPGVFSCISCVLLHSLASELFHQHFLSSPFGVQGFPLGYRT